MSGPAGASRIAIIGWGSLLWDPDNLREALVPGSDGAPAWALATGPALPLEFSRISAKRHGALTLVIDPRSGAPQRTHVAVHRPSAAPDDPSEALASAQRDLAARERAPLDRIGAAPPGASVAAPGGAEVAEWLRQSGFEGAVWTALPSNFEDVSGRTFSVDAGLAHLESLSGHARQEAFRYLREAPASIDTPLRRAAAARFRETIGRHI